MKNFIFLTIVGLMSKIHAVDLTRARDMQPAEGIAALDNIQNDINNRVAAEQQRAPNANGQSLQSVLRKLNRQARDEIRNAKADLIALRKDERALSEYNSNIKITKQRIRLERKQLRNLIRSLKDTRQEIDTAINENKEALM